MPNVLGELAAAAGAGAGAGAEEQTWQLFGLQLNSVTQNGDKLYMLAAHCKFKARLAGSQLEG